MNYKSCPFGNHPLKQPTINYEAANILESQLKQHAINRDVIYKQEFKIGMLPEGMIVEFMQSFYLKKMSFYSKISGFRLDNIEDSYLNEKYAVISLQAPYFYT